MQIAGETSGEASPGENGARVSTGKKIALSCGGTLLVALLAAGLAFWLFVQSLDEPIDGWQEKPRTPSSSPSR